MATPQEKEELVKAELTVLEDLRQQRSNLEQVLDSNESVFLYGAVKVTKGTEFWDTCAALVRAHCDAQIAKAFDHFNGACEIVVDEG